MLFIFVGIGILIYFLFFNDKTSKGSLAFTSKQSSEEILKTRFVNGEIDEKTYLQMKETLKG